MKNIISVDGPDAHQDLVEELEALRDREHLVGELGLVLQEIAHIAVLHHEEVPARF